MAAIFEELGIPLMLFFAFGGWALAFWMWRRDPSAVAKAAAALNTQTARVEALGNRLVEVLRNIEASLVLSLAAAGGVPAEDPQLVADMVAAMERARLRLCGTGNAEQATGGQRDAARRAETQQETQ